MKLLVVLVAGVVFGGVFAVGDVGMSAPSLMAVQSKLVKRVIDGDTIAVFGEPKNIRILGIDSPETKDPRKPVGCWGKQSSAWAASVLPQGTQVRLVEDRTQDLVDHFGRKLRYVEFLKDNTWTDFSEESARTGNSKAYVYGHKPVLRYDKIKAAEDFARANRLGLWGNC